MIRRAMIRRVCTAVAVAGAALGTVLSPAAAASAADDGAAAPLPRAHAHNDYEHERPLTDALSHGFTSVEADVYLVGGELLVAHDPEDLDPDRTLRDLYLDPLKKRIKHNKGSVFPGSDQQLRLWIDIKNTGAATYTELHEVLEEYGSLFTRYTHGKVKQRPVTAIVSGDRPAGLMKRQNVRFAFMDGRLSDLGVETDPTFMPFISDNWTRHFTWTGRGEMPAAEREKLHDIVETAHAHGQQVRFWATPDADTPQREAIWRELVAADVDLINTDDLAGLEEFLRAND